MSIVSRYAMSVKVLTFVIRRLLSASSLLLGRRLAVDVLLLGGALARSWLGTGSDVALITGSLGSSRLPATGGLLGGSWRVVVGTRVYQLDLDLSPCVASRARVAHTSEPSKLLVVDLLFVTAMCRRGVMQSHTSGGPDLSDCMAQPRI